MRFADIPARASAASEQRHELLQKLGLKEGEIELRVLMALCEMGWANVYELWKGLRKFGYYSTVLRALRRLKRKRLVNTIPSTGTGRRENIYTPTLLGELIAALAIGGWKAAAQILAERSPRFRECVQAHRPLDPCYYWPLTRETIESLLRFPKYKDVQPNLEELIMENEGYWISSEVVDNLYDYEARAEAFQNLQRLSHVSWIRSLLISFIDDYMEEEKEWLQTLAEFNSKMISTDKNAKLPQFFVK